MTENNNPAVRIEPSHGRVSLNLPELWIYRELIYFLIWRDIKVRYKQTLMGISWAIIQPFMSMVVFSIFFGRLIGVPTEGIPYPIFSYSALVPWTFFSNTMNQASNSLVNNANMIKKIYFPRLAMPIGSVFAGLLDFLLAFLVLIGMMIFYDVPISLRILALPGFVLMMIACSMGVSFWLSALNVQFRDIRYITPFLTQFWLFATPIAYSSNLLEGTWRTLYGLNPMAGVGEGFRWVLLGTSSNSSMLILISAVMTLLLLISGSLYFRKMESHFPDII